MSIKESAETWVRIDLFCDGLGRDGICAGDQSESLSDTAPTAEAVRKAILNAAVKARWRFDPKLQRWLCPECDCARDRSERIKDIEITDGPRSVPQKGHILEGLFVAPPLL